MYDDFYYEPSESEIAIEKLKEHLRNEVKIEIVNELEKLRKENQELQEIKNNWNKIRSEYDVKIKDAEYEVENMKRNVKQEIYNATLQELFDNCNLFAEVYEVDYEYIKCPKCSKCNEDRNYIITTPDGIEHKEKCSCNESYKQYLVRNREENNIRVYVQKGAKENNFYFRISKGSTYEYGYELSKEDIYKKAEDVPPDKTYKIYFTTYEEAKKFVDKRNKEILNQINEEVK